MIAALAGARHVLIVDECRRSGGVAEGLMALVAENCAVPQARVTALDSFIATGPAYAATLPSAAQIIDAGLALTGAAPTQG